MSVKIDRNPFFFLSRLYNLVAVYNKEDIKECQLN